MDGILDQRLEGLGPVLDEFEKMVIRYGAEVKGPEGENEAAYWDNEWVNVSLLATAAWRVDLIALAEYSEKKTWKGEPFAGRADLWIQFKPDDDLIVEAKYTPIELDRAPADRVFQKINAVLQTAVFEVADAHTRYRSRLGINFVLPYGTEPHLKTLWEACERLDPLHLLRWVQPEKTPVWQGKKCPGILLLGRIPE